MEADKLSFIAITAIVAMVAVVGLLGNTQTTTQAPAQPQVIQDPAGNVIGHAGMFGGSLPGEHDGTFGSNSPVGDVDHEFEENTGMQGGASTNQPNSDHISSGQGGGTGSGSAHNSPGGPTRWW